MRDHSSHIEFSREQAVACILEHCVFDPPVETVSLRDACGRVLAVDAVALLDMPNCLTCRMDSIAVHYDDFVGGMPDTSLWVRGRDWEFANTGIGMPEGFDTAIVIEHVQVSGDNQHVTLDAVPSERYAGTSPAGSRMHRGDVLAQAGTIVTPLVASHIASGGNTTVQVLKRPVVTFVPTGNELVEPADDLPRGKNIESNSLVIAGKVAAWGGEPRIAPIVPDDPALIEAAIRKACDESDIVVINAGSSKGSDDWNIELLESIGTVFYHETNHGPGHHSSFAVVEGTPVVGISGPPGGCAFTTDFYLRPAVMRYMGLDPEPRRVKAVLAQEFPAKKPKHGKPAAKGEERPDIVVDGAVFYGVKYVSLSQDDQGRLVATPSPSNRPGPMEADQMHGYYLLGSGPGLEPPKAGDLIEVELRG